MRLRALQQRQGFGVQRASLKNKNWDVELRCIDEVCDHHVFRAQAGGLGHGRKFDGSVLQQSLSLCQLDGKVRAGLGVQIRGFGRGIEGGN